MREFYIHSGKHGFEVRSVVTTNGRQSVHTHAVWLNQQDAERHLQSIKAYESACDLAIANRSKHTEPS